VLEEFIPLMENAPKVSQMRASSNPEYLAFIRKIGEEVRLVSADEHLTILPRISHLYTFYQQNKVSWLIPCATPLGSVYGYIIRSYTGKQYRVFTEKGAAQLLFGFEGFDERFRYGVPVVLVEGCKDAMFVQTVYPFCLAILSSDLTKATLEWLTRVTNRFIVALDRDESGEKHRKSLRKELTERKCQVSNLIPHQSCKDWGDYFKNVGYFTRVFRQQFFMACQQLGVKIDIF
jgi:5S rRNA maturation endonuclease (ribonuclease M5)